MLWQITRGGFYGKSRDGVSALARVEGAYWRHGLENCGDCAGERCHCVVAESGGFSESAGVEGGGCGGVGQRVEDLGLVQGLDVGAGVISCSTCWKSALVSAGA